MTKKLAIVSGLVIATLTVFALFMVIKNERGKRAVHANVLAEIRPIVSGLVNTKWEMASQEVNPALLCRLEVADFMWGDVDSLLQKAAKLGMPISFNEIGGEKVQSARREAAIRYASELVKAFDLNAKVVCETNNPDNIQIPELYFGRNSRTLIAAQEAIKYIRHDEVWLYDGIRRRAISLLRSWIEARKANRDPHADNAVEYLAGRFLISTNDLGLATAEEVRKYYLQL